MTFRRVPPPPGVEITPLKKFENKHKLSGGYCIHCKKSIDDLFIELVDMGHKEAGRLAMAAASLTGGYDYERQQADLVEQYHQKCLTDDELMIKDIIE